MSMRKREALELSLKAITPGLWGFRDYGGEALAYLHDSTQGRITGPGGVIIAKDVGRANAIYIIWARERFEELMAERDETYRLLQVMKHVTEMPEDGVVVLKDDLQELCAYVIGLGTNMSKSKLELARKLVAMTERKPK